MEDSEKMLNVAESTEEVAEETTDVNETSQTQELEFTDSSENETKENETSEEKTEEETQEVETKEESKEQNSDENAKFAQVRRKAEEEAQKKIEAETKKAYEKGKMEAFKGKINPYTEKPITDLADVEMYEAMFQLESDGKDPIKDLPNYLVQKRREEVEAIQKKREMETKTQQEINDFSKKYPDVNLGELLKDSFFNDYIQGKNKPIVELYESFNNFKTAFRNSAVGVAKQTLANAQASPGSLGSEADVVIDYSTMSSEEFNRQVQMVKDGDLK